MRKIFFLKSNHRILAISEVLYSTKWNPRTKLDLNQNAFKNNLEKVWIIYNVCNVIIFYGRQFLVDHAMVTFVQGVLKDTYVKVEMNVHGDADHSSNQHVLKMLSIVCLTYRFHAFMQRTIVLRSVVVVLHK